MQGFVQREEQWILFHNKVIEKSPYDSDDEYYMETWLQEALLIGLINHYTFKPERYVLYDNIYRDVHLVKDLLFGELIYTPDFDIEFTEFGRGLLFDSLNHGSQKRSQVEFLVYDNYKDKQNFAVIDVKPSYVDKYGSSRDFRYIQRLMYDRYGIYVNKTVILDSTGKNKFFAWTFVPKKYLFRSMKRGNGFLKVNINTKNIRTSEQYIQTIQDFNTKIKSKKK
jgi:hypothetical protein